MCTRWLSGAVFAGVMTCALAVLGAETPGTRPESHLKSARFEPGRALFAEAPPRTFRIEVAEPGLGQLQKDNRNYVRAAVTEGGRTLHDVGVHLKGMGSFRPLNEKPSFSVKFDRYVPDQLYDGMSKFMLNNGSQDGTYLAELMATEMFREAGVPAARVIHAFVEFNGRDLGLYVLIEAMNKEFLRRHFKSARGNLYEAYLADIDSNMDQDGGETSSQEDRKQLVEAARLKDPLERWRRLQDVFEVDRYLSHLTIELFTSHVDGYAYNRNNYRLYHDPATDKFTMIAHGIDWAFANGGVSLQPPRNSILTKAVLQTPEGARRFKERRAQLFTNVFQVERMTSRIDTVVARLKAAARNAGEAAEFERGGVEMRNRIVSRAKNIAMQLAAPEPQPLVFDSRGSARLAGWQFRKDRGEPAGDEVAMEGVPSLHLRAASGESIASWRAKVLLEEGRYRFQALARTVQVEPLTNKVELGNAVGIRISGDHRTNGLSGDISWTTLEHEFVVTPGGEEKELVCELRASKGDAWFDKRALLLLRLPR